jgi:hypothetical protein
MRRRWRIIAMDKVMGKIYISYFIAVQGRPFVNDDNISIEKKKRQIQQKRVPRKFSDHDKFVPPINIQFIFG